MTQYLIAHEDEIIWIDSTKDQAIRGGLCQLNKDNPPGEPEWTYEEVSKMVRHELD